MRILFMRCALFISAILFSVVGLADSLGIPLKNMNLEPVGSKAYEAALHAFMQEFARLQSDDSFYQKNEIARPIKVRNTKVACNGQTLYLFIYDEIMLKPKNGKPFHFSGYTGSGGSLTNIFLLNPDGGIKKLFEQNVIQFLGMKDHSNCSSFFAILHGSKFSQVGDQHGIGKFEFDPKSASYKMKK